MSETMTRRIETTVDEDEQAVETARGADTGVESAETTTANTAQVGTQTDADDDAVLQAGDPTATGSRGEQASEQIEDLGGLGDPDGDTTETPETWDPADVGLDTPEDFSDMTGLGGTEDPFEEPFSAEDPESWGESLGIGPDGSPLDDAGEFTPGDLKDALTGQREGLADGIIDETDIGLPGADAFGSGSALPDPTGFDYSDPRGTPSVTDAMPGADPRRSTETDTSATGTTSDHCTTGLRDRTGKQIMEGPHNDALVTNGTISGSSGQGQQGPPPGGSGGTGQTSQNGSDTSGGTASAQEMLNAMAANDERGEETPQLADVAQEIFEQAVKDNPELQGDSTLAEVNREIVRQELGLDDDELGYVPPADTGPQSMPNPDAGDEDVPEGLDIIISGAPSGPPEVNPFDSLVQHQDPSDAGVHADAARALMNKLANPLDPYTYPADDDGEVPDGMVLPGGGIQQTDPFESLIQPSGPDTGLSDPSTVSTTAADGYSESVGDAWDGLDVI